MEELVWERLVADGLVFWRADTPHGWVAIAEAPAELPPPRFSTITPFIGSGLSFATLEEAQASVTANYGRLDVVIL